MAMAMAKEITMAIAMAMAMAMAMAKKMSVKEWLFALMCCCMVVAICYEPAILNILVSSIFLFVQGEKWYTMYTMYTVPRTGRKSRIPSHECTPQPAYPAQPAQPARPARPALLTQMWYDTVIYALVGLWTFRLLRKN